MSRHTLIFPLRHLDFVKNMKKLVVRPSQQIEFLGLEIDTPTITLSLTEQKMEQVILKCQNLLSHYKATVLDLTELIGLISSTVRAVLLARLQLRYLDQQQINTPTNTGLYIPGIVLNSLSKQEVNNGISLRQKKPNLKIQTNASKSSWRPSCYGVSTGN